MPRNYVPIFIVVLVAMAVPVVTLALGWLLRPAKPGNEKLMPYECGITPEDNARQRYTVRFYIIAILFVIFDVETVFLFPWAVLYSTHEEGYQLTPLYGLLSMFVFLGILIIGYIWLFRKKALEWV